MIELFTLGRIDLKAPAGRAIRARRLLAQPKALAVTIYLASTKQFIRRDSLVALFWPDLDDAHARNILSKTLARITAVVGEDVLDARGTHDVAVRPDNLWCDARALEGAASERADEAALNLFRGEFLPGWHLPGLSEFSHWIEARRRRFQDIAERAASRLAERHVEDGDTDAAVQALRRGREIAPANEQLARRLMALLEQQHNPGAALEVYRQLQDWLHCELGVAAASETQALAGQIRERRTTVAALSHHVADAVRPSASSTTLDGLAVLPLCNLTGDPDQEYLTDGLADAVTTQLAQVTSLRLISRQSTLRFKGSVLSLAEIADQLNVDAIVEGSVARSGERLRVTAQLVQARPERHLWARSYERPMRDALLLQADIAGAIAEEIGRATRGAPPEIAPPRAARPVDPVAYEAYLKGRFFSGMLPELPKAIGCFREAIARDPAFVPGWAGLAMAYANLALFVYLPPVDALDEVARATAKALELDEHAGEAYMARGLLRMLGDWDWRAAGQDLQRAVELAPGVPEPHVYRAVYLTAMGDFEEGLDEARRAMRLDPLGPGTRGALALCLYKARRYQDAIQELETIAELYPQPGISHPLLAPNLALAGRPDAAVAAARRCVTILPEDQEGLAYAAAALGLSGQHEEGRQVLDRLLALERDRYIDPWAVAVACSGLGDSDEALRWLRRLRERRSPSAFCVKTEPLFEPLHTHPEYQAIVRKLAYPSSHREDAPTRS
jgi:TolB-like protein/Tfp pilus assembly protein PilF